MHSNRQREALMALKDGPMSVQAFNAAHNGPDIFELSPNSIEFGHQETPDGIERVVRLTQAGHSALADRARNSAAATRMAGQMIDQLGDKSASAQGDRAT
jgi:hypothetical protein